MSLHNNQMRHPWLAQHWQFALRYWEPSIYAILNFNMLEGQNGVYDADPIPATAWSFYASCDRRYYPCLSKLEGYRCAIQWYLHNKGPCSVCLAYWAAAYRLSASFCIADTWSSDLPQFEVSCNLRVFCHLLYVPLEAPANLNIFRHDAQHLQHFAVYRQVSYSSHTCHLIGTPSRCRSARSLPWV